jgi:hypothetical protein
VGELETVAAALYVNGTSVCGFKFCVVGENTGGGAAIENVSVPPPALEPTVLVSVAVIVQVPEIVDVLFGVPDICPVVALKDKPAGGLPVAHKPPESA